MDAKQGIVIESGLWPGIVLQRSAKGVSDARITGACRGRGPWRVRITRKGRALPGITVSVSRVGGNRFQLRLKGVPCGGPYRVELAAGASVLAVDEVYVGDVWLLGGQSNMEGLGFLRDAGRPHPMVRAFTMDDRWGVARDPLHMLSIAVDPVHGGNPGGKPPAKLVKGVGPGLYFGIDMWKRTGVPQGLIACAHGGTSMAQWDPARRDEGGRSLYGAMVRRLRKNGGRVAGLLWYQGESDANAETGPLYHDRMVNLIRAIRRDTGDARLPVAMVQISRVAGWLPDTEVAWNALQEAQRLLPLSVKRLHVVPAIDLTLDDGIHISGRCQKRLGRRLAEAMDVLRRGAKAGLPPITLRRVSARVHPETGQNVLSFEFDHVRGSLRAGGRPLGFAALMPDGRDMVYDVQLHRNRVDVVIDVASSENTSLAIHYGLGHNPACTITDAGDRSLPAFGPLRV
ncbi:MAG TPA: sialate O-acetylesterase [Kiritimatiellia bacterium]|nr:sialate O-acetylesterase [Kiritimatiellia bacterium]